MRLVIEVTETERSALSKLTASLNTSYSTLFRTLMRLTLKNVVPRKALLTALAEPRPILNITLIQEQPNPPTKPTPETPREKHKRYFGIDPGPKYTGKPIK